MLRLVKYAPNLTFMFPSGEIATSVKIKQQFPAVEVFPHVLEVNGHVCQAVMEIAALRELHGIDESLTESEAIEALEVKINAPPPEPEVTAEERIAAALEFQNLLSL